MSLYSVIQHLSANSKRTDKTNILQSLEGEELRLFLKVAKATFDPEISYYITGAKRTQTPPAEPADFETVLDGLSAFANREVTGNAAKQALTDMMNSLSVDDSKLLALVIKRNLNCGVSESTINAVWPDTIYQHPYRRCSDFNDATIANIKMPCYSQTKEDGLYLDIIVGEHEITYRTRSGQIVNRYTTDERNQAIFDAGIKNAVIQGEALVLDEDGNIMPRKDGNGYLNRDVVDPNRIIFVCWDLLDVDHWRAGETTAVYKDRFEMLCKVCQRIPYMRMVDTKVCNSNDEIIEHFKDRLMQGKEGTVVKNMYSGWENATSKDMIKFKIEFDCELVVVAVEEGEGRNEGRLGAVVCESSDRLVTVSVGGGYSDKQRLDYFTQDTVGKIFTVRANELIQAEDGSYSLFLPRFIEERTDKTEADSFDKINAQREAYIQLLGKIGS